MTIIHQFSYQKVSSLRSALCLMEKNKEGYALLAGGTDLVGNIKEGMCKPSLLIDIKGIGSLSKIVWSDRMQELKIGALVTYSEILNAKHIQKHFPLLAEAASKVASQGIRNRATIVGNICSAVPCLDAGSPLMVYEGNIEVVSFAKEKRLIPIHEWFTGVRKTSLERGEMVTAIIIKRPAPIYGSAYAKLGRYEGEDLAQATVSVLVFPDHRYKIAFGSVAPTPVRAHKIEALLNNNTYPFSEQLLKQAKDLVEQEIAPIDDVRASKEYRMHMSKIMMERTLAKAFKQLTQQGKQTKTQRQKIGSKK